MLQKPDLQDDLLLATVRREYGLPVDRVEFLPLGADVNTAVYRVTAASAPYFLKLRRGPFDATSVELPAFLSEQGLGEVIAPLRTQSGRPWARLDRFTVVLYPFIAGRDGYQQRLSDRGWIELGAALQRLHTLRLPPALRSRIRRETFSPHYRQRVLSYLQQIDAGRLWTDPVALETVKILQAQRSVILDLVERADQRAQILQARTPPFVLCHADLHAGNVLIAEDGALHIVDWDDPILAPKERDLMFPGGAQGFGGRTPQEEEALFYRGYGETDVDRTALAYYRCERIVVDIKEFCEQLLESQAGGEDREQSLHYLKSNFLPGNTIEAAYRGDGTGE